MKKIIFLINSVIILILFSSCNSEFTLRGNRFGDSIEQVKQMEEDDGIISENNGQKSLRYIKIKMYQELTCSIEYIFENNELKYIMQTSSYNYKEIDEVYNIIINELGKYGSPDEESKKGDGHGWLWAKDEFGIALFVTNSGMLIIYSSDSSKVKKFYNTLDYSDLLR